MTLKELCSVSHTEAMVVFLGYEGDNQEPIYESLLIGSEFEMLLNKYGSHKVAVIEAVYDSLFIWLNN